MSDILERLENYIPGENDDCVAERIAEAVAEIKRLRAENRYFREATLAAMTAALPPKETP